MNHGHHEKMIGLLVVIVVVSDGDFRRGDLFAQLARLW